MQMPGRKYRQSSSNYRYGFNGQEKESDLNENITTALFWEYDSRIGRRWNIDPVYKSSQSLYVCFSDNPIWRIDPLGNSDTTVGGVHYADNKTLSAVVVTSKSPFPKKVMQRIREDARASTVGNLYIPGMERANVKELIQFTRRAEAQSLGEMLQLSRYQQTDITLGNRMQGLIMADENFKKFEQEALQRLRSGDNSYTSPNTVLLGGDRGSLVGLVILTPSSGQTWSATVNELTWALRNVYVTATIVHGNSTDGKFTVNYHIEDDFDLVPGNRSGAYNAATRVLGSIYHGLMDNSGSHVTVDWNKTY